LSSTQSGTNANSPANIARHVTKKGRIGILSNAQHAIPPLKVIASMSGQYSLIVSSSRSASGGTYRRLANPSIQRSPVRQNKAMVGPTIRNTNANRVNSLLGNTLRNRRNGKSPRAQFSSQRKVSQIGNSSTRKAASGSPLPTAAIISTA